MAYNIEAAKGRKKLLINLQTEPFLKQHLNHTHTEHKVGKATGVRV